MTRINVIPPYELCDQHLLAEFRELTRIPNGILSGKLKAHYDDRPSQYTLGKGHVKFFTDKLRWLFHRYYDLFMECEKRGFMVLPIWPEACQLEMDYFHPTEQEISLNKQRIKERWPKQARYYGVPMQCPY